MISNICQRAMPRSRGARKPTVPDMPSSCASAGHAAVTNDKVCWSSSRRWRMRGDRASIPLWNGSSGESGRSHAGPGGSASRRHWTSWLRICGVGAAISAFAKTPEVLVVLTRWVQLRLRAALWRQWKTPRRRRAALAALRISGELRNTASSGLGPWPLARSKALCFGLSNAYFKSLGLPSLFGAC